MAASMSVPAHHVRGDVCGTRPSYREGRDPKAVKVYTVNQESCYLLIQGVPAVGATQELIKMFAVYGPIQEYRILDDYPTAERFVDVYLIKFSKIQSARIAKKKLDDWSFYGGVLHVCYAPEYETVDETRIKLQDRRKTVAFRIRKNEGEAKPNLSSEKGVASLEPEITTASKKAENNQHFQQNAVDHTTDKHKNLYDASADDHRVPPIQNNEEYDEGPQYWIPAPPRENPGMKGDPFLRQGMKDYQYAKVPTAHATLPENYDARLSHSSEQANVSIDQPTSSKASDQLQSFSGFTQRFKTCNQDFKPNKNAQSTKGKNSTATAAIKSESITNNINEKDFTKTENSQNESKELKEKSIGGLVVRHYQPKLKSGPPKFVPRQTMNLMKKTETPTKISVVLDDEINKELKKNTFKLGVVQGPVTGEGTPAKEAKELCKEEKSIENTRSEIRKRIAAFSSEIIAKKKKKEGKS